jgi:hypothetical protein
MAMTFTYTDGGAVVIDFLNDTADMLNGVVPTDFGASYTDVEVAMFEGTIVLENAKKGVQFQLQYTFTDGEDAADTAVAKLQDVLDARGFIGTLVKDNVTLTGVMLRGASIQSRRAVSGLPFTPFSSTPEILIISIGFHKVDA